MHTSPGRKKKKSPAGFELEILFFLKKRTLSKRGSVGLWTSYANSSNICNADVRGSGQFRIDKPFRGPPSPTTTRPRRSTTQFPIWGRRARTTCQEHARPAEGYHSKYIINFFLKNLCIYILLCRSRIFCQMPDSAFFIDAICSHPPPFRFFFDFQHCLPPRPRHF